SAEHGEGLADLYEALRATLPEQTAEPGDDPADEAAQPSGPIRVAIVGRPNSGKSTLVNRVIGEERLLTGPEAGIPPARLRSILRGAATRFASTTPPGCAAVPKSSTNWKNSRSPTPCARSALPKLWWC